MKRKKKIRREKKKKKKKKRKEKKRKEKKRNKEKKKGEIFYKKASLARTVPLTTTPFIMSSLPTYLPTSLPKRFFKFADKWFR